MKKLLIAAAVLLISAPAFADRDHGHDKHHWKHHNSRHHYDHGPRVVVVPRPVYVQPAPIYYSRPAPVYYYAPPAPVYYPAPASGVSIRFNFPL
jgi:hypothetical protein